MNGSQCSGRILVLSSKQTVFKHWIFQGPSSTNALLCLNLVIDWAIPTTLFSSSGTNSESLLQYVLDRSPTGRSIRISSSSPWWMGTDSNQKFPGIWLIFPSIIWILPVPWEEIQPNTMTLPPPNFTVFMVFLRSYAEPLLLQTVCGIIGQKNCPVWLQHILPVIHRLFQMLCSKLQTSFNVLMDVFLGQHAWRRWWWKALPIVSSVTAVLWTKVFLELFPSGPWLLGYSSD